MNDPQNADRPEPELPENMGWEDIYAMLQEVDSDLAMKLKAAGFENLGDFSDAMNPKPEPPRPAWADLEDAIRQGNIELIGDLINSGADVHYQCENGYDAIIDAVCHNADRGTRLIEVLKLLIGHDVNLSGITTYQESALRVASRVGRFDAIRLLLEAGADKGHLLWTPLMEAVAQGSLADVQAALERGAELEAKDWWSRTAWLIALLTGEIEKAELLLRHGADPAARGRCGHPPLFYAIEGHHPHMVRWLLAQGADVDQSDESGCTALIEAVEKDDAQCVDILLAAGADHERDAFGTAIHRARSRRVILSLLEAGADPADITYDGQRVMLGMPDINEDALATITAGEFCRTFAPAFGTDNPQRMDVPFWLVMIRCGIQTSAPRDKFDWDPWDEGRRPVWCANRLGQSLTLLPDGRAIQIGGEHEDYYDPDFHIYNDVFVHHPDGSIAIYGYPESIFPPTDFHTATLIDDFIYIIGRLGYSEGRTVGRTPIHRLNIHTLGMESLEAAGQAPGWLYRHRAARHGAHEIRVWGGKLSAKGAADDEPNSAVFILDLDRLHWRRE